MTQQEHRAPAALALTATAWVLIPTWIYICAFLWAANSAKGVAYVNGLAYWVFIPASLIGFLGGPLWLMFAAGGFFVLIRKGERPTGGQVAVFAVLSALIFGYLYQMSLD